LLDGGADAMWVYADQVKSYQCGPGADEHMGMGRIGQESVPQYPLLNIHKTIENHHV
jgi:hypothetical protein